MIQAANIRISFGNHLLFDDVNFTIGKGEKVGLVGRNGSGKTTLLNLLCGQISADDGTISMPRDYTVGYMQQKLSFTGDRVLEEACLSLRPDQKYDI
jgi:ATP-binding cassette subfamily F protein 3